MTTPQLENGYLKIAIEIMEALIAYRIPGEQRQCLDFILRKTYGFNKKEDCISNSQFCEATGMNKVAVCRAINGLVDKNIVIKKDNSRIPSYCFNKNYNAWKKLSKKITVIKKDNGVIKKDNRLLSKKIPTKENYTKETIQKKYRSNGEWFEKFWELYPKKIAKKTCKQKWKTRNLDNLAERIIADVKAKSAQDRKWLEGYIPNPMTYINQDRWEDEIEMGKGGTSEETTEVDEKLRKWREQNA